MFASSLFVVALAACGGTDQDAPADATTVTVAAETISASEETAIPEELVGTYETKRPAGALPAGTWKLAIGPEGEFFLIPPEETGFFGPPVAVTGTTLVLPPDPAAGCAGEGRYTYTLTGGRPGGTLTLKAEDEPCPDRAWVMQLSSWTRTD